MPDEDKSDISAFLLGAGFEEEDIHNVLYELSSYRSIPGTTLRKYVNRVLATIEVDHRNAFLKGILLGTALHEHVENYELEGYINAEVTRRLKDILAEIDIGVQKID